MRKKTRNRNTPSPLVSLLLGTLTAAVIFALTSLLFSIVTYLLNDPTALIPLLSLPAFLLSGLFCALFLYSPTQKNLRAALLSVLLFLLILLLIGVITCHGAVSLQILLFDIGYLLSFFVGCVLRSLGTHRRRRRF